MRAMQGTPALAALFDELVDKLAETGALVQDANGRWWISDPDRAAPQIHPLPLEGATSARTLARQQQKIARDDEQA